LGGFVDMNIPSFFEGNAYRVLRLGAGAAISEAHEAASRMKRLAALDMLEDCADDRDRPELGSISRTEIDINSAISRLQQPKSRLLDRLFWFHFPSERIDEKKSSHLQGRFRGEPQALVAILHDRALELLVQAVKLEVNETSAALWAETLSTWHDVISDEAYWALTSAIEERGQFEPVAFPSDIAELEEQAQKCILRELVRVAHTALNSRDLSGLRALLTELMKLDRSGSLIRDTVDEIVSPLQHTISDSCQVIANTRSSIKRGEGEASGNLAICNSNVELYRKTVEPALASLVRLLPANDPLASQASRDGAKCLQGISIDLTWADDFSRSEKLHEEALKLAGDAPIASEIEASLQEVKKTAKRQRLCERILYSEWASTHASANALYCCPQKK
jgi:hypothetical protein